MKGLIIHLSQHRKQQGQGYPSNILESWSAYRTAIVVSTIQALVWPCRLPETLPAPARDFLRKAVMTYPACSCGSSQGEARSRGEAAALKKCGALSAYWASAGGR